MRLFLHQPKVRYERHTDYPDELVVRRGPSAARGRPFSPGVSGNPGGRPKGFVRRIREETCDGAELVDFMLSVFRDEREPTKTRVEAATWLADRGFGKPTQMQTVELRAGGGFDVEGAKRETHPQARTDARRRRAIRG